MAKTFGTQVDAWCRQVEARMHAVFKEAAQQVAEEITLPGPSVASSRHAMGKASKAIGPVRAGGAGHMPVDTGFLAHSLVASTSAMPKLISGKRPADGAGSGSYTDNGEVDLVIDHADPARKIYLGFTAEYAAIMEHRYGFVRLTAQRWPQIVQEAIRRVKQAARANLRM